MFNLDLLTNILWMVHFSLEICILSNFFYRNEKDGILFVFFSRKIIDQFHFDGEKEKKELLVCFASRLSALFYQ